MVFTPGTTKQKEQKVTVCENSHIQTLKLTRNDWKMTMKSVSLDCPASQFIIGEKLPLKIKNMQY